MHNIVAIRRGELAIRAISVLRRPAIKFFIAGLTLTRTNPRGRLLSVAEQSQVVLRVGVLGLQLERAGGVPESFVEAAESAQRNREVVVRLLVAFPNDKCAIQVVRALPRLK